MSEPAFSAGLSEDAGFLADAISGASFSSLAGSIITSYMSKRVLRHVLQTRRETTKVNADLTPFRLRHSELDCTLSQLLLLVPFPSRIHNAQETSTVQFHLNVHSAMMCLNWICLETIHHLPLSEMQVMCFSKLETSAKGVTNILRATSDRRQLLVRIVGKATLK